MQIQQLATAPRTASIDTPDFKRHLFLWLGAGPGAPSDDAYRDLVKFIEETRPVITVPQITLNARQLQQAALLANPQGDSDPDQQETVVTLSQCDPFTATELESSGELVECQAGIYLSFDDIPEEGMQLLSPDAPIPVVG